MRYSGIPYEAFGERGECVRDAQVIGELPWELRREASEHAARNIAQMLDLAAPEQILAGVPVYRSFGMRPADAKRHTNADLLMTLGTSVPLSYCN
jgi:hypothetical protein